MELNDEQKVMLELDQEWLKLIERSPELTKLRERNVEKAMAEVTRQGRLQELKEVIKAHPGCSIITSEQGNLFVMAVIGKRLLRRNEIVFQLIDEQTTFESIVKIKRDALISFLTKQQKLDGSIVFNKNMIGRDILALNKERFEIDSKLYLAAKMLSQCEVIQSHASSRDAKLFAAHELGILFTRFSTFVQEGRTQAKAAKQPRKSTLNNIIKKLAKRNGTAKELWLVFFGELDDNGLSPIECSEELKYFYKNPDGKDQSIKFKTFENKLSLLRKDNLSH